MTCIHLQQLFSLCKENDLKLGSSDLVRVVCQKCNEKEVCPSTLMDEYDSQHGDESSHTDASEEGGNAPAADPAGK